MLSTLPPEIVSVIRGYSGMTQTRSLSFPTLETLESTQDYLVKHILLDPHLSEFPPSPLYQRSFWKWIISNFERRSRNQASSFDEQQAKVGRYWCLHVPKDFEIDGAIYQQYVSLLSEYDKKLWKDRTAWLSSLGDQRLAHPSHPMSLTIHSHPMRWSVSRFWNLSEQLKVARLASGLG